LGSGHTTRRRRFGLLTVFEVNGRFYEGFDYWWNRFCRYVSQFSSCPGWPQDYSHGSSKDLSRSKPGISYLQGDPTVKGPWQESVKNFDAIINLAGATIFSRWTDDYKRAIRESRMSTTRNLVEAIPSSPDKNITLFSTSAVGYYGFHGDEELVEESPPGNDFLARLAIDWEGEALKAKEKRARVVTTRFGIVLGERRSLGANGSSLQEIYRWTHR
jgi:NAD dependent epimerase/dehydratase family enzyme